MWLYIVSACYWQAWDAIACELCLSQRRRCGHADKVLDGYIRALYSTISLGYDRDPGWYQPAPLRPRQEFISTSVVESSLEE